MLDNTQRLEQKLFQHEIVAVIFYNFHNLVIIGALDLPKPIQNHVKTIPGHTAFDPQSMVQFGQT